MIEFYPQIKLVHIAAVLASGALFLLRGARRPTRRALDDGRPVALPELQRSTPCCSRRP